MRLFKAVEVDETTPVQYAGIYVMKWQPDWGVPDLLFREIDADHSYKTALERIVRLAELWNGNQMGGYNIQRRRWQKMAEIASDALHKTD